MLLILDLLTGKLVSEMLSWKSDANESDGLATCFRGCLNWQQETWSAISHLAPVMPESSVRKNASYKIEVN